MLLDVVGIDAVVDLGFNFMRGTNPRDRIQLEVIKYESSHRPRGFITVPDGTEVSAFLNATDTSQEDVPWGALGEMSVAAGRINKNVHSWVHVHPAVTQVTYLVAGQLTVRMKEADAYEYYDLMMVDRTAVLSHPGTLIQLRNDSDEVAEVLYILSPSYVFEMEGDRVIHDDSIKVSETWEELEKANYDVPALRISSYEAKARHEEAKRRLAERKGFEQLPLAEDSIRSVSKKFDYLAPDGSEIRLLASGERGGLAHCVLPAGKTSSSVQHRTVEELWYVIEGMGTLWRGRPGEKSREDPIKTGDSIRIGVGTSFMFRASAD